MHHNVIESVMGAVVRVVAALFLVQLEGRVHGAERAGAVVGVDDAADDDFARADVVDVDVRLVQGLEHA